MSILKNGMKLLMNRSAQNALGNKCLHTPSSLDAAKAVSIKSPIARAFASGEPNEDKFSNMPVERSTCTLIPSDGVYPELMNSVQTVLKAMCQLNELLVH